MHFNQIMKKKVERRPMHKHIITFKRFVFLIVKKIEFEMYKNFSLIQVY